MTARPDLGSHPVVPLVKCPCLIFHGFKHLGEFTDKEFSPTHGDVELARPVDGPQIAFSTKTDPFAPAGLEGEVRLVRREAMSPCMLMLPFRA